MKPLKVFKDYIVKYTFGAANITPRGLYDMSEYFRRNRGIDFDFHKSEDGTILAVSTNFRYGSIITEAKNENELDKKVRDAIMTSFEVPSSYSKEANIRRVGAEKKEYVLA